MALPREISNNPSLETGQSGLLHANLAADAYQNNDKVKSAEQHDSGGLIHNLALFGEGIVSSAVLKPVNAVEQVANSLTGAHLPQLELANQDEVDHSTGGKIGNFVGKAVDVGALTVATGGVGDAVLGGAQALGVSGAAALEGTAYSTAISVGAAGAVDGAVLTQSDPSKQGSDLIVDRLKTAGIDGATFAIVGGLGKVITPKVAPLVEKAVPTELDDAVASHMSDLKDAMPNHVRVPLEVGNLLPNRISEAGTRALTGVIAGTPAGIFNAEATATIKDGRLATIQEVAQKVEQKTNIDLMRSVVGRTDNT
jgi:hypothetical protein